MSKVLSRDYKDIVGGGLLVVFGLAYSWYAASHYEIGELRRMGSGMFPAALGLMLAGFGIAMIVPALFRRAAVPDIRIRTPLFVLSSVAAFAVTVPTAGLIPAVLAVTVISSGAERTWRPLSVALLCAALCLIAWLVFRVGLGLATPMVRWPF